MQADIEKRHDLALKPGSHLLVFMCPRHNDSPSEIESESLTLPEEYWNKDFGHYKLILNKNPKDEVVLECEEHILPGKMVFEEEEEVVDWDGRVERGTLGFKIGGVPAWQMAPDIRSCACGAEMIFVAQVPQFYNFIRNPKAEVQADTHDPTSYNLFAGKHAYIFACKEQCHPEALYVVAQELERSAEEVEERAHTMAVAAHEAEQEKAKEALKDAEKAADKTADKAGQKKRK